MKGLLAVACAFMLAVSPLALAQDKAAKKEPTEAQKKQQERMKSCNARAGDRKLEGDARKQFMSSCLKGDDSGPSPKQKAQQQKMTDCNKQAASKKLEGDARKNFMSSCLKG